jgi:hypothetical protein
MRLIRCMADNPAQESPMKKQLAQRTVAAAAAAAVTLAVLAGVVAIADHEKDQAVLLAARINPQNLASSGVDIRR